MPKIWAWVTTWSTSSTLRINGRARHESATGDGLVSKLKIVIYPDSNAAKNETSPLSGGTGEIRFIGTNKTVVSGFINSGDVTTTDNGNVHQLTTAANLSKVIAIPSNFINTATVSVEIDPNTAISAPASAPPTLILLALLLMAGATWFLMRWRRERLA